MPPLLQPAPQRPAAYTYTQPTIDAVSQDANVLLDRSEYAPVEGSDGRPEPVTYPHVEFNVFRPLPEGVLETSTALTTDQPADADAEQVYTSRAA